MYTFAVLALLALAVVKLTDFLVDHSGMRERESSTLRSVLTFALALAGVWMIDFSIFDGWEVAVRNDGLGVWITGFMVAGFTVAWRALFGYLTHDRATPDETLGDHRPLRKVA